MAGTETEKPSEKSATDSTISMMTEAQLREPKSTIGVYELPCGYLDSSGVLHTDVLLNEITGRDEDMLANGKIPNTKKMNQLLVSCIGRLGSITDKGAIASAVPDMLVGDRVFLILAIRRVSLGDDYPYKDSCPSCAKESLMSLDLSTLDTVKMPHPKQRVFDARLPSRAAIKAWAASTDGEILEPERSKPTGMPIRFKVLCGRDEEKSGKAAGKDDSVSLLLSLRIEMLNDKPPTIDDLQSLTLTERQFIRDVVFRKEDGGIDTTLDVTCPMCQHEYTRELDIGQMGFFFPSAARKTSKTRSST